jgi:hypothetical protein
MTIEQFQAKRHEPPTADELARRRLLVERIRAARRERSIAPLTTADLVRQAREEEERSNGGGR